MAVTYVDPAAEDSKPAEPYELFLDMAQRPLTIGLVANAFPDATNFTNCLETALIAALPGVTFKRFQKTSVDPVPDAMLVEITAECDGMVSVWGH
jgi:hypothetical protein